MQDLPEKFLGRMKRVIGGAVSSPSIMNLMLQADRLFRQEEHLCEKPRDMTLVVNTHGRTSSHHAVQAQKERLLILEFGGWTRVVYKLDVLYFRLYQQYNWEPGHVLEI
jgi:hypothetical protein